MAARRLLGEHEVLVPRSAERYGGMVRLGERAGPQ
jgi:hypothetical protein